MSTIPTKAKKKLDDALGAALEVIQKEEGIIVDQNQALPEDVDNDLLDDYKHARETLRNLIRRAEAAMISATHLADSLENPRGYEVVAALIKAISDASKDLLEIQKRIRDIQVQDATFKQSSKTPAAGTVTNNNTLVLAGTATDLQKQLKELGVMLPVPK